MWESDLWKGYAIKSVLVLFFISYLVSKLNEKVKVYFGEIKIIIDHVKIFYNNFIFLTDVTNLKIENLFAIFNILM